MNSKRYIDLPPLPLNEQFRALLPRCTVLIYIPSYLIGWSPSVWMTSDVIGSLVIGWFSNTSEHFWKSAFRNWTRLEALDIVSNHADQHRFFDGGSEAEDDYLPSLRVLRFQFIQGHIPFPPTTPNTLHTVCFLLFDRLPEEQFLDLIHRHSASLRRVCIHKRYFEEDTVIHTLITALSHLRGLESLVVHTIRRWSAEALLLHLPSSLTELSIASDLEPFPFAAFQTFLQSKGKNPTIEIVIWNANSLTTIDKRWTSFTCRPDARVIHPRKGERLGMPQWTRTAELPSAIHDGQLRLS